MDYERYTERRARIDEARQHQPLAELERKATKARTRHRFYTQEELDLAGRRAADQHRLLRVE